MNIIKRSGEEVEYDGSRIINAIKKANNDVPAHERLSDLQAKVVEEQVRLQIQDMTYAANVEEIQDMVIKAIMAQGAFELAKVYTEFRYKHMLIRKSNSTDDSILSLLDQNNEELKQENSNKNPMIASTQRDYMAGEVSKDITDRILLPEDIVKANNEAEIHFHDRDYFAMHIHNCFTGYTEFVTDHGIRKFSSFNDGDTVIVTDKDGVSREATVRCYGNRSFNEVTFKADERTKVVYCTPDHRWLLSDGTVTTNLKVDDVLIDTPSAEQNSAWKVVNIRENVESGLAWCVEEPVTHSFMLSDGMVTGNCDLINLEDMLQNGTVISGTMIDKPKSLATACNIATQIIAQVASNQYGQREVA